LPARQKTREFRGFFAVDDTRRVTGLIARETG
jgi:hypothetical protein